VTWYLRFTALLALATFAVLPVFAQRLDKKASGRGEVESDCSAEIDHPCMFAKATTPGASTGTFISFGDTNVPPDNADWDVFKVSTSQSVTFSSALVGSFLCGDDSTQAQLDNFCTGTVDTSAPSSDFLTSTLGPGNLVTFNFISTATDLPSQWVFYADRSDDVSIVSGTTPEPATFFLMGGALFGMLVLFLRKR
jgi:hypothetical protein